MDLNDTFTLVFFVLLLLTQNLGKDMLYDDAEYWHFLFLTAIILIFES